MKSMRKLTLFLCGFILSLSLSAQSRVKSNRPPWLEGKPSSYVVGRLPDIVLEGNILDMSQGRGKSKEKARLSAINDFVKNFVSSKQVTINDHTELNTHSYEEKKKDILVEDYKESITIDGKTVARYKIIDEYYEYAAGEWHYAGLFLVAKEGMTLAEVPPITYGVDHGAWRSFLLPGWAQFYQRRTVAGIGYLTVQAGVIGTSIYLNNLSSYYKKRQNEAFSINVKQDYKKRYDKTVMLRNISVGICAAWYVLNIVDAFTSQRGRLYYTTSYRDTRFSVAPTIMPDLEAPRLGLACTINF